MKLDNLFKKNVFSSVESLENVVKLKEGTDFKGKVLKIQNDKVVINLKGDSVLEAKVKDITKSDLGKILNFSVESFEDGILELVIKESKNVEEKNSYKKDKDFSKNLHSIDKDNINLSNEVLKKVNDIMSFSKDLDIKKAIFLAVNNLDKSEENIKALLDIENNKFNLSKVFDDIKSDVDLLDDSDLKEKLNTIINKKFTIDPKFNLTKEEINKIYNEINNKLNLIKSMISDREFNNKDSLLNKIDLIQNSLNFLDELSDVNSYLQIPLKIFDKESKGELFVLKRDKNKKKINPEDVSMVISLDTENIGIVDSIINVKKKNISVNMAVSDKDVVYIFKRNQQKLYKMLNSKGYSLVDYKCKVKSEKLSLINFERFVEEENNKNISNKIDYRL